MNLFIDTSTLVKLYHDEDGTEELWKFISQYSADLYISISDITPIEFHSAIYKQVRTNKIKNETAAVILESFITDINYFNIIEIDTIIKDNTINLLNRHGTELSLKTLDALQLSSAIISNINFPLDYFVTSDKNLIKISDNYFRIFNPVK
jgi:uncharacterized protein